MQKLIFIYSLVCLAAVGHSAEKSSSALPRSAPESQGISSSAILDFIQAADREVSDMNSFMLVRHGAVVAEGWWTPYAAETPHVLYSLSKSFTSTAVGLAVAEGKLSIDDTVLKFFPEEASVAPTNNLRSMRLRDLLCMSAGHQTEVRLAETNPVSWTKLFLAHPVPHKPGAHFLYNTAGTYMQSAIVQKATGMTVLDYLQPRLFQPLGIDHPTWGVSPEGISLGGYGLNIRTEDIAKFGQLFLQKGKWHGKQLVPAVWVEAATSRQTSNGSNPNGDWDQGYGYQFWRCRHGAYRGDGAFGQFCVVMPDQDAVVAITSGTRDMQAVLNLIWDKLLPAMQRSALPSNPAARKKLEDSLARLAVRAPQGSATSSQAQKVSGRRFVFPANDQKVESIALECSGSAAPTLLLRARGGEYRLSTAVGGWKKGRMAYGPLTEQPVAASGAWTADDTFTFKLCFYEGPSSVTASLKFSNERALYDAEYNVAFGPAKQPQIIGIAE
ncbi:MAG: serine hydrolase [Verrucomicrobia bacterium]|nr:serine hydrolase [Verrucomicrobiota bacterium]MBI3871370.1 serine hydrolase [Verrucomicrobiota bacterium]